MIIIGWLVSQRLPTLGYKLETNKLRVLVCKETDQIEFQLFQEGEFHHELEKKRTILMRENWHLRNEDVPRDHRHEVKSVLLKIVDKTSQLFFLMGLIIPLLFLLVSIQFNTQSFPPYFKYHTFNFNIAVVVITAAVFVSLAIVVQRFLDNRYLSDVYSKFNQFLTAWIEFRLERTGVVDRDSSNKCSSQGCDRMFWGNISYRYGGLCHSCYIHKQYKSRKIAFFWTLFLVLLVSFSRYLTWQGVASWFPTTAGVVLFLFFSNGLWGDFKRMLGYDRDMDLGQ